jgi:predicted enzyme related to lactoylglutathione lyase
MNTTNIPLEFRYSYYTPLYAETVAFYKDLLQWEIFNSWDRGFCDKGTIFKSPNGTGLIEIEEGTVAPTLNGELYIQVEDVDHWYELIVKKNFRIINPLSDTTYGHRNFKFADPNHLIIGFFKYL